MPVSVPIASDPRPAPTSLVRTLADVKVGPMSLPLYLAIAAVVTGAAFAGKLPQDMIGGFAAIMVLGFLLGTIGGRIPLLKDVGGAAILCLFVPSALLGYGLMPPALLGAITAVMKTANFLYLYIACLVTGSMLGMNRRMLVQGFLRMFVPIAIGTAAAVVVGVGLSVVFGHSAHDGFFFIVMPIIAGGIGEGILPLSLAYSEILGTPQPQLIAALIPAALIGNVVAIVAIVASGLLRRIGEALPRYSGNGVLVRDKGGALIEKPAEPPIEVPLMGAGLLIACGMFTVGVLLSPVLGIPGPIVMILGTALIKVSGVIPARMETAAHQIYKFMTVNMTFPLLVGLGTLYVPWNDLVAAFTLPYLVICTGVVLAMVASGWAVGRFLAMYPVESAIVSACHSGLGGTGDVAILSAAGRMELMPFAQIATRIGGAMMVVVAVLALKAIG